MLRRRLTGIPVSPGLAIGIVVVVRAVTVDNRRRRTISAAETATELGRFDSAVLLASQELREMKADLLAKVGKDEAAIFEAQRMMLEDPAIRESVENHLVEDLVSAEKATTLACEEQARILEGIDDPYLSGGALDLRDIAKRVVRILSDDHPSSRVM